ncbi:MAG: DNA-directed RNA polymerase subunit alpha, DNA-directed RNA polymerase subunit alpha [Microgenomates group bacterium GW2011_GWC1_41_20]|uniref:DNA-directed RNA polymerase subunit alpha n=5 Tax=Candidatus Woeseibacteriota TaxID=1752722 RepID=A0A0G0U9R1_9BACT|nr:MAG: DNA-directed RNA polymerase subunit alpha [Candidatus Woesebacteria bacterium GW2011_GWB1_40_12]KKR56225.1 MAG: DNA-directed RNA polymerase subunit alpha [Candidatus Woesebacteria bacterium GW2011_GWF1_40_24]KKS00796.1 MAG: DNA-directed RNA polymerase subunit alpha, DNA-directed RNA polymerase subunit alpha [Microgenomates group bacterium GW2011_GWC1_41_20]KKS05765.1 MAG: DNA-directed RNA polymerase subunit alpha [Candidatus Woesebacteria bacterium GW2011_GWE1_41_24]KKS18133.1 MAG: DNA-
MNEPTFEIKEEKKETNYGRFVISPLEQGYGLTVGNALRRVLLVSLPGIAITSIKIAGVKHQFSTLSGLREDTVEFILNLKKVRFSGSTDKPVKATLEVDKAGEFTAKDIKVGGGIVVANPDLILGTINKGSKLSAEMTVESGFGFSPAEERPSDTIGLIPVDSSFSPIKRVSYKIEETRVGRLTNYDKLILEVWTDGTIEADSAIVESAKILMGFFAQIVNPKKVEKKEEAPKDELGLTGKLSVEEIGLPTRVANALIKAGFETVEQLAHAKKEDLVKVRNLGEKSLKIVAAALGTKGVEFLAIK